MDFIHRSWRRWTPPTSLKRRSENFANCRTVRYSRLCGRHLRIPEGHPLRAHALYALKKDSFLNREQAPSTTRNRIPHDKRPFRKLAHHRCAGYLPAVFEFEASFL
jgi:hypothetical protein